MNQNIRLVLLGLAIWIAPFIIGFFFYDATGQLNTDIFLFKSIMIMALTLTCTISINIYSRKIESNFLKQTTIAGLVWLIIALLLDRLILIPMSQMSMGDYIIQIGLRYTIIPIISISSGFLLKRRESKTTGQAREV